MNIVAGSLDTTVLARLLLKDDIAQHNIVERLLKNARMQLEVADTALIELTFILEAHYKLERNDIRKGIESLLSLPILKCNRTLIREALPLFANHPKLSFEDCCLAVYAELNDAKPLWTFDKKLASQAPAAKLLA